MAPVLPRFQHMAALLIYALTLLLAAYLSNVAARSVLSLSVLFLVSGFLAGNGMLELIHLSPGTPTVREVADLALFAILFSDGMQLGVSELVRCWKLPGRALLFGLPITLAVLALTGYLVVGLTWREAFLLGAVLSPTDPVFAAAFMRHEGVPQRLRHLLNVESGVNDGIALPIVLALLASYSAVPRVDSLLAPLVAGVALGVAIPWAAVRLERLGLFSTHEEFLPLADFAIGLIVLSLARLLHVNEFLAAFAAGITLASVKANAPAEFRSFGNQVADLFKFAALLMLGVLLTPAFFRDQGADGYLYVLLALFVARPIGLSIALLGSGLSKREWVSASWFGPKGFSSVIYSLYVLRSGIPNAERIAALAGIVITISIVLHSSTDVPLARWMQRAREAEAG
jgi:NhaP-type Na+/H+ or K+/H+ antiporter